MCWIMSWVKVEQCKGKTVALSAEGLFDAEFEGLEGAALPEQVGGDGEDSGDGTPVEACPRASDGKSAISIHIRQWRSNSWQTIAE